MELRVETESLGQKTQRRTSTKKNMANSGANVYIEWEMAAAGDGGDGGGGRWRGCLYQPGADSRLLLQVDEQIQKKINKICKTRLYANQTSGLLLARTARCEQQEEWASVGQSSRNFRVALSHIKKLSGGIASVRRTEWKYVLVRPTRHAARGGRTILLRP